MEIRQEGAHVFRLRDGKVVRLEIFATQERAIESVRPPDGAQALARAATPRLVQERCRRSSIPSRRPSSKQPIASEGWLRTVRAMLRGTPMRRIQRPCLSHGTLILRSNDRVVDERFPTPAPLDQNDLAGALLGALHHSRKRVELALALEQIGD